MLSSYRRLHLEIQFVRCPFAWLHFDLKHWLVVNVLAPQGCYCAGMLYTATATQHIYLRNYVLLIFPLFVSQPHPLLHSVCLLYPSALAMLVRGCS